MARHKARRGEHAIKGRKKRYRINLDGGLHDRLLALAKAERPHYKDFIAAWKEIKKLGGKLDEMNAIRRGEMLVSFVRIAESLVKKYDHNLQKSERRSDRKQYIGRMNKVFRIAIWDRLQTQSSYGNAVQLDNVIRSTDAMVATVRRHGIQAYDMS